MFCAVHCCCSWANIDNIIRNWLAFCFTSKLRIPKPVYSSVWLLNFTKNYKRQYFYTGKRYKQNTSLLLHLKSVHASERAFECKYCKKMFRERKNLTLHQRKEHSAEPRERRFECKSCRRKFTHKGRLEQHRKMIHATTGNEGGEKENSKAGRGAY